MASMALELDRLKRVTANKRTDSPRIDMWWNGMPLGRFQGQQRKDSIEGSDPNEFHGLVSSQISNLNYDTADEMVGIPLGLTAAIQFRYAHTMVHAANGTVCKARLYRLGSSTSSVVKSDTVGARLFQSANNAEWLAVGDVAPAFENLDGGSVISFQKVTFDFGAEGRLLDPFRNIYMLGVTLSNTGVLSAVTDGNSQGFPYQAVADGTAGLPSRMVIAPVRTTAKSPFFVMLLSERGLAAQAT